MALIGSKMQGRPAMLLTQSKHWFQNKVSQEQGLHSSVPPRLQFGKRCLDSLRIQVCLK